MFNVYLNDGNQIPDEQACYILAKDGVYLKKDLGMIQSITKVKEVSFLENIQEQAQLNIEKLPVQMCGQIQKFFRDVCIEHKGSEAISLLYYNPESKEYKIVSPPQSVAGGSCDFIREVSMSMDNFFLVGDIHSHGNGSAFHSGTDDADEKTGVDGLHVTFGFVAQDAISISASITVNGKRFHVEPDQYLEGCSKIEQQPKTYAANRKTYKMVDGKMVEQPAKTYTSYSYLRNRYKFDVSEEECEYPEEWFKNVEYRFDKTKKTTYATTQQKNTRRWQGFLPGYYNDQHSFGSWEEYWAQQYEGARHHPLNVGPASRRMIGEGYICEKCPYKQKALAVDMNDDFLSKDDGSAAYVEDPDELVEDQLTNSDFLSTTSHVEDIDDDYLDEISEDELPENLRGKPKSWIREFFGF